MTEAKTTNEKLVPDEEEEAKESSSHAKKAEHGELVSFIGREVLDLDDRAYEVVEIPEWSANGTKALVRVRGLTGSERDSWEASLVHEEGSGRKARQRMDYSDLRAKLIVRSVVDGEGNRIFTDRDASALGAKSASALQRIFEVCQRLSRLTDEDVEDLVGESSGTRNGADGST